MKRYLVLLALLLVITLCADAKKQSKVAIKKATICLTVQAENGSIKQKFNEDGTITCIIKPGDVIRVTTIYLNGEDVTNQLEKNKLVLPVLTENTTLEISFEEKPLYIEPIYNTVAMN
jgi:hypothetical protein